MPIPLTNSHYHFSHQYSYHNKNTHPTNPHINTHITSHHHISLHYTYQQTTPHHTYSKSSTSTSSSPVIRSVISMIWMIWSEELHSIYTNHNNRHTDIGRNKCTQCEWSEENVTYPMVRLWFVASSYVGVEPPLFRICPSRSRTPLQVLSFRL